jgi:hypothetical protein
MKRVNIGGLCVVAVFAMSAVLAASASAALPEFSPPFPKPFTSTSKTTLLQTVGGAKLTCAADTNVGEITAPQSGFVKITFTGCKLKKIPCNTPGVAPGEIITGMLSMKIGYINKAKKEVGVDLEEPTGAPFITFVCGAAMRAVVIGSVIGRITPVNKVVVPPATFKLKFAQTAGVQKIAKLEGGPIDVLETSLGGPFEGSGLASTDLLLFGEPVKLMA